jgi:hypothetical protein
MKHTAACFESLTLLLKTMRYTFLPQEEMPAELVSSFSDPYMLEKL